MIRTFRLYKLQKVEWLPTDSQTRLPNIRLSELATRAPRPLSRSLSDLAKLIIDEKIELLAVGPPRWEFQLTGRWPARATSVAIEPPPRVPVKVNLWIEWLVPWLIVFEANRDLAEITSRLIAAIFAGGVSNVEPVYLDEQHWQVLKEWVEADAEGVGALLGGRFYKPVISDIPVESLTLRCAPRVGKQLLNEAFQTASGIGELLIKTRRLKGLERSTICRINRLGMVWVYGTEVPNSLIQALVDELKSLWGFLSLTQS